MSQTVVWCTPSVDTSAIFLAQALDAEIAIGAFEDLNDTIKELLADNSTKIIFYGSVDHNGFTIGNKEQAFNTPVITAPIMYRQAFLKSLRDDLKIKTLTYKKLSENSYTSMVERIGKAKFDIVTKTGELLATVDSASKYNQAKILPSAIYACEHLDRKAFCRVFIGNNIMGKSLIGCISSINKQLSYKETLMLNRSAEVKTAIADMFDSGIITEDPTKAVIAWSEQAVSASFPTELDSVITDCIATTAEKIRDKFKLDFVAIDYIVDTQGNIFVSSATGSPSLQDSEVLFLVSDYFKNLLQFGRKFSKKSLLTLVDTISEDNAKKAADILKEAGLLNMSAH